jgi:SAM-dependent methyltransferase
LPNVVEVEKIHEHWLSDKKAERYAAAAPERSHFLVEKVSQHMAPSASIVEIGCNAGRNLHYLHKAGYQNLSAVEMNPRAVDVMRVKFPELAGVPVTTTPIEETAPKWRRNQFDLTFTMAVLLHIHPDSEWVFQHIAKATRSLFVIEAEEVSRWHIFPRNYAQVFTALGATQIAEYPDVAGLPLYTGRLFDTSQV